MVLAGLFAVGCPGTEGVDTEPTLDGPFRVMTWNVRNLFDERDNPESLDEVLFTGQVDAQLSRIGDVIRAADPDFVFLQEVENEALLHRLVAEHIPGRGYLYRGLTESGDPRGINIGYISRFRPTLVANHQSERFRAPGGTREFGFARDAVEVFLEIEGISLILIGLHLRSRRYDGDEHRLAEATQLRTITELRRDMGQTHILAAGDFNDTQETATMQTLIGDGPYIDVTDTIPPGDQWTIDTFGRRLQFDYILATPSLAGMAVDTEVFILRGPEITQTSDHAAVMASFDLLSASQP